MGAFQGDHGSGITTREPDGVDDLALALAPELIGELVAHLGARTPEYSDSRSTREARISLRPLTWMPPATVAIAWSYRPPLGGFASAKNSIARLEALDGDAMTLGRLPARQHHLALRDFPLAASTTDVRASPGALGGGRSMRLKKPSVAPICASGRACAKRTAKSACRPTKP